MALGGFGWGGGGVENAGKKEEKNKIKLRTLLISEREKLFEVGMFVSVGSSATRATGRQP